MAITLGLDIGSNSVGSAWIDLDTGQVELGMSVFPAGVEESDEKRGEPKNARRRSRRRTRITLARRAERKRLLRARLAEAKLLPRDSTELTKLLYETDPWELRRKGLDHPLTPHEFGRVLLHLAQHRGALGLHLPDGEPDESDSAKEEGEVKKALKETQREMERRKARTFGEMIAIVRAEAWHGIAGNDGLAKKGPKGGLSGWWDAVRNKAGEFQYHADRALARDEFSKLWDAQAHDGGALSCIAEQQREALRIELDDPGRRAYDQDPTKTLKERQQYKRDYRQGGLLFRQRMQTWDLGTLGRCVLEPTERCVPIADRHASYFRVLETVNNIRITIGDAPERALTADERDKVKAKLRQALGIHASGKHQGEPRKSANVTDIREALGYGKKRKGDSVSLNIEKDEDREINTDWFHREIVQGAIGEGKWNSWGEQRRESVNRAILKLDPEHEPHEERLRKGATSWWELSADQADRLVKAWQGRPKLEKRLKLSRRAILTLLPYMERFDDANKRWPTQQEARKAHAAVLQNRFQQTGDCADEVAAKRYSTGAKGLNARDRHYMRKHPLHLPPAPMLLNPVVRKAIHEVRRHIMAYISKFGRKPDRVFIELAREARMGKKDADRYLETIRLRQRVRKGIIEAFKLESRKKHQQEMAVERVLLAVQQNKVCPLCGNETVRECLTELNAANGVGCEVAHILPHGSGGPDSLNNKVLAHRKCNQNMRNQTPKQWWSGRFSENMRWVEAIYKNRGIPKRSEVEGQSEWACYFSRDDDHAKLANFHKDISDLRGFTDRQLNDTRYATRQVMAYLADALFDGTGLPERGGLRRIFAVRPEWTGKLRREWGLFFDPHEFRARELSDDEEHKRKEKDRGDHRHHAVDAVAIALATPELLECWQARVKQAEIQGVQDLEEYYHDHRLAPKGPWEDARELRERVKQTIFPEAGGPRAVAHRPTKRRLIGALHEEKLLGVLPGRDSTYTGRVFVADLTPNHLRKARKETVEESLERLTRHLKSQGIKAAEAKRRAQEVVEGASFQPKIIEPPPSKSGLVRDWQLRRFLREEICERHRELRAKLREELGTGDADKDREIEHRLKVLDKEIDLETPGEAAKKKFQKQLREILQEGPLRMHPSGVPVKRVVLLRTMDDPVIIDRRKWDEQQRAWVRDTGRERDLTAAESSRADRAYVGGNNHHVEIRCDAAGHWSRTVVRTFDAAKKNRERMQALRAAGVPSTDRWRKLPLAERRKWKPVIIRVNEQYPTVNRSDDPEDGSFVMSLAEGETVYMKHPTKGHDDYFVVFKLDTAVHLVHHWDARASKERKDAERQPIPGSAREEIGGKGGIVVSKLRDLAPSQYPGGVLPPPRAGSEPWPQTPPHPLKVRVSPLGEVTCLDRD